MRVVTSPSETMIRRLTGLHHFTTRIRSFRPWTFEWGGAGNDRCFSKRASCDRPPPPRPDDSTA